MAYSTSTLAQGCFGKVYKEKYNDTWAAIKKVPQQLISRKDLERECEVYNKSEHPNIVKLLGNIILKDGKWIIPLEFVFGEDLETTIFTSAKSKIQLTPENKGTIIVGMCEGLLYLHSKDIVHQDLKPDNIMVEHHTNRAVIIDLGLAKFFRYGLNSAIDMGNEAYSAPEVLRRTSQRDQRSDVWAMGKIIAELCARLRLHTPTVCPAKILETLKDQPYCHAVCRMVEPNPTLRASMGGVISEIRRAAGEGVVTSPPVQKEQLKPPSPPVAQRKRSPSPVNRDALNRNPSPVNRDALNRNLSPMNRDALNRNPSPMNRDALNRNPSPIGGASPLHKNPSPSPLKWERTPRPDIKPTRVQIGQTGLHKWAEDMDKNQRMMPAGAAGITQDLLKMKLTPEAVKDLPSNLPTNGRVVVRRFEKKDGQVGTWVQTEVVMRDGKIVEYKDNKFNNK